MYTSLFTLRSASRGAQKIMLKWNSEGEEKFHGPNDSCTIALPLCQNSEPYKEPEQAQEQRNANRIYDD